MTEEEWQTASDFSRLHTYLWENIKTAPRKYRLAACGIYNLITRGVISEDESHLLALGESFADDPSLSDKVGACMPEQIPSSFPFELCYPPDFDNYNSNDVDIVISFMQGRLIDQWWEQNPTTDDDVAVDNMHINFSSQTDALGVTVLRDIFGNPFRPIVADPAWLTPTVQAIAAAIYQDRAFDRLPILADALEEAGCTNADVLLHCRQPGEHVRGCWVVDLVLGKK